jgi:hypothetical protein
MLTDYFHSQLHRGLLHFLVTFSAKYSDDDANVQLICYAADVCQAAIISLSRVQIQNDLWVKNEMTGMLQAQTVENSIFYPVLLSVIT